QLIVKSDVYAYGVVLLELLTGIESQCLRLHSCPVPLSPTCQLTVKNDVYACGVPLLKLLTGIGSHSHVPLPMCLSPALSVASLPPQVS
ncbi:unnamed protein product, partial [Closterium sp. NIES-53]